MSKTKRVWSPRPPGDFQPRDVVYIFGSDAPGVVTGIVVRADDETGMVLVTPKGADQGVWFQKAQLKRIAGRGGPK